MDTRSYEQDIKPSTETSRCWIWAQIPIPDLHLTESSGRIRPWPHAAAFRYSSSAPRPWRRGPGTWTQTGLLHERTLIENCDTRCGW